MDLEAPRDEVLTQKDQANTCVSTAWLRLGWESRLQPAGRPTPGRRRIIGNQPSDKRGERRRSAQKMSSPRPAFPPSAHGVHAASTPQNPSRTPSPLSSLPCPSPPLTPPLACCILTITAGRRFRDARRLPRRGKLRVIFDILFWVWGLASGSFRELGIGFPASFRRAFPYARTAWPPAPPFHPPLGRPIKANQG